MNARFSFLLVLLACFCIAITSAANNGTNGTNGTNVTSANVTITVTNTTTITVTNTTSNATSPHATPIITASISASGSPVDNCPEAYTCLGNSDSTCTGSWLQNLATCTKNNGTDCCAFGLICVSGTCQTNNIGATCNSTAPISGCLSAAGEKVTCNNGTCAYQSLAGDNCDSDNICASGLTCNGGICTGASAGQSCNVLHSNCSAGLYCDSFSKSTCVAYAALNANCTSLGTICAANLNCTGAANNKTCQPLFTTAEGGACGQDNDCSDENICLSSVCAAPITDSVECTTDTDCQNGGICTCSQFTGDSYCTGATYNSCQSENADALNCQVENNCTSQSVNTESCFYQNCYSELKAAQSCGCDSADDLYGDCFYNDYCGGFPGWAIALIIIGSIAVVLAVVAVVFVAMRRKNTYDSI